MEPTQLLEQLIEMVRIAAGSVWAAAMRRAWMDGAIMTALGISLPILSVWLWCKFVTAVKMLQKKDYIEADGYSDSERIRGNWITAAILTGVFGFITALVAIGQLWSGLTILAAPELQAIEILVRMMGRVR